MVKISFGVEFEFDSIKNPSYTYTALGSRAVGPLRDGFGTQADPTAGTELRSPIFVDVKEAADKITRFFRQTPRGIAPIMKGNGPINDSMGQHIHIGLPNRRLSSNNKRRIATHAKRIYPLLTAIHANDKQSGYVSRRGATSRYCTSIGRSVISSSHYGEISDSQCGTVEFRKFDSNIPQATLTCATVLKVVALAALRGKISRKPFDDFDYTREMQTAVQSGLRSLDVEAYFDFLFTEYAEEWAHILATETIPDCVWEVLHLAYAHKKCVADIGRDTGIYGTPRREYEYFDICTKNAGKFFELFENDLVSTLAGTYTHNIEPREIENIQIRDIETVRRTYTTDTLLAPETFESSLFAETDWSSFTPAQRTQVFAHALTHGYGPNRTFVLARARGVNIARTSLSWEIDFALEIVCTIQVIARSRLIRDANISNRWMRELIHAFVTPYAQSTRQQPNEAELHAALRDTLNTVNSYESRRTLENIATEHENIYRINNVSISVISNAMQMTEMSSEEMRNSDARFYFELDEQGELLSVAEAHVRCSCNPGLVRIWSTSAAHANNMARIMTEIIEAANRTIQIVIEES